MNEIINLQDENKVKEYENFVRSHKNGFFTQSVKWAHLKANWNCEIVAVRDENSEIKGTALILIKKIPLIRRSLFYCPHGPICDYDDEKTFRELIDAIDKLAKERHAYQLKIDPCISEKNSEYIQFIKSFGFDHKENASELSTIQVRDNYMLYFYGRSKEELFASFHKKWRYNIRVAERHGVKCSVCGKEAIDDFYTLMTETGARDDFLIRGKSYFADMLDKLGDDCSLYMCYCQGVPLSGAICVRYAGKSHYVYGASSSHMRNVMPNYLMQWTMISDAVDNGCFVHDFQGIPFYKDENHPNYGVYRFKKGFNGEVVTYAGEFYPSYNRILSAVSNFVIRIIKRLRQHNTKNI